MEAIPFFFVDRNGSNSLKPMHQSTCSKLLTSRPIMVVWLIK